MRIDIDIAQPLLPGVFLPRPNLNDLWISLKYEKLPEICYNCGIIGHEEKDFRRNTYFLPNPFGSNFKASGSWLRLESDLIPIGVYKKPNRPSSESEVVFGCPPTSMSNLASDDQRQTPGPPCLTHAQPHLPSHPTTIKV